MILIRNATPKDTAAVIRLARFLNSYNLPADVRVIRRLIKDSLKSFRGKPLPVYRRCFIFIAEDTSSKRVVGCSLIIARHGTPQLPHLSFKLGIESKTSVSIKKTIEHRTLKLHVDRTGFTEIGGLVVHPKFRRSKEKLGKQLSYVRFAYMSRHPHRFRRRLLVEYLPKQNTLKGNSLWHALGEKFTHLRYQEADRLSALNKEFILRLFPKEKIYCSLLPKFATKDIALPSKGAEASLKLLQKIGFRFLNQVDPFDGGPHYGTEFSRIGVIKHTVFLKVHLLKNSKHQISSNVRYLIMKETKGNIRAIATPFNIYRGAAQLPPQAAQALKLHGGEKLSVTPFGI